jgi:hypothetical protein
MSQNLSQPGGAGVRFLSLHRSCLLFGILYHRTKLIALRRWAPGPRPRPACGPVALARAPLGATGTLWAAAGHEPHLWEGDGRHGGCIRPGALLPAVCGDDVERSATEPTMATAHLERVCFADAEACVGDGVVPSAQGGRRLWTSGLTSDGACRVVSAHRV